MAIINWDRRRNLENSLCDFIQEQVVSQDIDVLDEKGNLVKPQIRVGWQVEDDWKLPNITLYVDSKPAPRKCIGSNARLASFLVIIDIRACDIGTQMDLSEWVMTTINDGWDFYEYSPNPGDPDNELKVKTGYVSFDINTDTPIRANENADQFDQFRQNITISCTITQTS